LSASSQEAQFSFADGALLGSTVKKNPHGKDTLSDCILAGIVAAISSSKAISAAELLGFQIRKGKKRQTVTRHGGPPFLQPFHTNAKAE
jgi:hypothetical protein